MKKQQHNDQDLANELYDDFYAEVVALHPWVLADPLLYDRISYIRDLLSYEQIFGRVTTIEFIATRFTEFIYALEDHIVLYLDPAPDPDFDDPVWRKEYREYLFNVVYPFAEDIDTANGNVRKTLFHYILDDVNGSRAGWNGDLDSIRNPRFEV